VTAELVPADRLIGQILADRYQVLHRLGEGAMGVVYKARHVKVGRTFAVKVLHSRLLQDTKVAQRFDREAELAGRLRHANVVGVVDVGEIDGLHYMVMDFAEGPDLAQLLAEAPMPPARIIHLVRQLLEGLYHAHEQSLIHRDFKPENVIVERDSHGAEMPRIVDFGIAILREGGDSTDSQGRLTTNGLVLGTPHYMAPEQAVADPIDHRIDLFALGIVIYEMLSGRLPFDGSGAEVARANLLLEPPPISTRVPHLEVDPLLEAFARKLMAKKPKDRPATAKVARELLDLVEHDRTAAASALGLVYLRVPAETQPLESQQRPPLFPPDAPETRRLRATPSPGAPVDPPFLPPPALSSVPANARPLPGVPPHLSAPTPFAPTAVPAPTSPPPFGAPTPVAYDATPTPMPIPFAYSAPHQLSGERAPELVEHQTSVRMPLSWPGATRPPEPARRKPWVILGVAAGTVGIALGAFLALRGGPAPQVDDHTTVAMTPTPVTPPAPAPVETPPPPVQSEPAAAAVPTPAPAPSELKPAAKPAKPPLGAAKTVARKPPVPAPAKPVKPSVVEVKHEAPVADETARPAAVAPPPVPAPAKPAKPAAKVSHAGISSIDLSALWTSVGNELMHGAGTRLPPDQHDELKRQYTLMKIQQLMGAPQPDRDAAAAILQNIADQMAGH
jgi:serine/threonine protein kinase